MSLAHAGQFHLSEARSLSRCVDGLLSHFLERRFLDNFRVATMRKLRFSVWKPCAFGAPRRKATFMKLQIR
jgi:hypothetical protein